jgi:hypothetical protein
MVFHNSRNRRAPFSDFKDSKLAALLINVKKSKERGHDPNDKEIHKMMLELNIPVDEAEAKRMWHEDCKPLLKENQ